MGDSGVSARPDLFGSRLRVGPHSKKVRIQLEGEVGFLVVWIHFVERPLQEIQVGQEFTLHGIPDVTLYPGDGGKTFATRNRINAVNGGCGINDAITPRKLDGDMTHGCFHHQLPTFVGILLTQEYGYGKIGADSA